MSSTILGIIASSGGAAAATGSYESIASATGTGSNSTITFSSIPSTYKHLQIRALTRDTKSYGTVTTGMLNMMVNSSTGSYTWHRLTGDGSAADAGGTTGETYAQCTRCVPQSPVTANVFGAAIIDIADYASTTKNKTIRSFGGTDANTASTQFQIQLNSNLWTSTAAITSLSFIAIEFWAVGTTIALYGIKG